MPWADGSSSGRTYSQLEDILMRTPRVTSLPALPSSLYPEGRLVVLTAGMTLWSSSGSTWDQIQVTPAIDLDELLSSAFGYFTQTFSRMVRPNTFAMVSGRTYYTAFPIKAGQTVNAIDFGCHGAGAALTLVKFGVISLDFRTLYCVSADEKAQYGTTGLKTNLMLTPYTSPVDQVLYGVSLSLGTTGPSGDCSHAAGRNSNGFKAGAAAVPAISKTSSTDLIAVPVGAGVQPAVDGNAITYWLGFS